MKTTTFDASELGLLERDEFKLEAPNVAIKLSEDELKFVEIQKINTTLFVVTSESDAHGSEAEYTTLRAALKAA